MSTYSFQEVNATFTGKAGSVVIALGYGTGIAEEGITVSQGGPKNTMTIGADGQGMHSLHADKSGTITVRRLKTSPVNAKLKQAYDMQANDARQWGANTIVINNMGSNDQITATKVAFQKAPDLTYAKDGDIIEWVFDVVEIDSKLGAYDE